MIDGGLVEFVRNLKDQSGGDVGIHASISVVQALLASPASSGSGHPVSGLRLRLRPLLQVANPC
ncbi:MAG: hypothetical protein ACRDPO_13035 [Streptosporangiaceae bacterium]